MTTENLEAKLQHASYPLFPLTVQLLHLGDCNVTAHSHPIPNSELQYQYPTQHFETRSLCHLWKLAAILTWLLNAAWDMWQDQLWHLTIGHQQLYWIISPSALGLVHNCYHNLKSPNWEALDSSLFMSKVKYNMGLVELPQWDSVPCLAVFNNNCKMEDPACSIQVQPVWISCLKNRTHKIF